jgi:hypothetical protein
MQRLQPTTGFWWFVKVEHGVHIKNKMGNARSSLLDQHHLTCNDFLSSNEQASNSLSVPRCLLLLLLLLLISTLQCLLHLLTRQSSLLAWSIMTPWSPLLQNLKFVSSFLLAYPLPAQPVTSHGIICLGKDLTSCMMCIDSQDTKYFYSQME